MATTKYPNLVKMLGLGEMLEIERAVAPFCMDLATMAFYTDFLFTKESRLFRYSLMREPA